jgi:hypothetical protein
MSFLDLQIYSTLRIIKCLVGLIIIIFGIFTTTASQPIYFLVGYAPSIINPPPESYVILLSKDEDILHARYLIDHAKDIAAYVWVDGLIVAAKVIGGKDGINRNYLDPKFTEWSWHVDKFYCFCDYTIEVMDGSPSVTEKYNDWSKGSAVSFDIGFWCFTVVQELGPAPLYLSIIPSSQNLEFYWSGLGTNYLYTLESKEITSTNWVPVTGATWPLNTNQWILPKTNAISSLYRVTASLQTSQTNIIKTP